MRSMLGIVLGLIGLLTTTVEASSLVFRDTTTGIGVQMDVGPVGVKDGVTWVSYSFRTEPIREGFYWAGIGFDFQTTGEFSQVVPWVNRGTAINPVWRKLGAGEDPTKGQSLFLDGTDYMGNRQGPSGDKNVVGPEWDTCIPVWTSQVVTGGLYENGPQSLYSAAKADTMSGGYAYHFGPAVTPSGAIDLAYLVVPEGTAVSYRWDFIFWSNFQPESPDRWTATKSPTYTYMGTVPEPATTAVLSIGLLGFLRRARQATQPRFLGAASRRSLPSVGRPNLREDFGVRA